MDILQALRERPPLRRLVVILLIFMIIISLGVVCPDTPGSSCNYFVFTVVAILGVALGTIIYLTQPKK